MGVTYIRFIGGPMDGQAISRMTVIGTEIGLRSLREISGEYPGYRFNLDGQAIWEDEDA